ncbi:hypothetical protein [Amycolatopsis sp. NPDC049868]|uniref:WD40 repeat domain-containing protein n=1 Tax=Amycolatopsis sp. NPDC049868 TaxID=3363934 RepID=UPI0037B6C9C0
MAYVAACRGSAEEWERRWHAVAADLYEQHDEPSCVGDMNVPYVGLAAYGPDDTDRFFGRERLVDDLAARVHRQRFLAVFGPSGVGKSSILRAGLIPKLKAGGAGPLILLTPGPHPLSELSVHLARHLGTTASVVRAELATNPLEITTLSQQILIDKDAGAAVIVVVDQFEEVFTLCHDLDERSQFIDILLSAAKDDSRCRTIIGVRADFYSHCAEVSDLAVALQDAQVTVGPMTAEEMRRAISRPAVRAGCTVETSLVTTLVGHAHGQAGVLPLVSHALLETWRRRKGNTLTLAGFQAAGGLANALARTAEAVFSGMSAPQQSVAHQLFRRLTALGDHTEDTKRRITRAELDDDPDTTSVVDIFAGARLLVLDKDTIEITHEALINAWPRLRDWLDADRDGQRIHRELADATARWETHRRDPGTLLRGVRLTVIQDWVNSGATLTQKEGTFLRASITVQEQEQRATHLRIRRQRRLIVLLLVLVIALIASTVVAVIAQRSAKEQRAEALAAKSLATNQRNTVVALNAAKSAVAMISSDRPIESSSRFAGELALAAHALAPSDETRNSVLSATVGRVSLRPANGEQALPFVSDNGRISGTYSRISDTTQLWFSGTWPPKWAATLRGGHEPPALTMDGSVAVTVDSVATVRIWNVADLNRPTQLYQLPKRGRQPVIWNGGRLLVTQEVLSTSPPGTGEWITSERRLVWELTSSGQVRERSKFSSLPTPLPTTPASSPLLVTASRGNDGVTSMQTWDLSDPAHPRTITAPNLPGKAKVNDTQFFPDSDTIFLASDDGAIYTINVNISQTPQMLSGFTLTNGATPSAVAISNDGRVAAVAGRDGRILTLTAINRMVGTITGELMEVPRGLANLAFSPGENVLLASDSPGDGSGPYLLRWDLDVARARSRVCTPGVQALLPPHWDHYFPGVGYQSPCD